jgi:hypothetical protein
MDHIDNWHFSKIPASAGIFFTGRQPVFFFTGRQPVFLRCRKTRSAKD